MKLKVKQPVKLPLKAGKKCPVCGNVYYVMGAISRVDNKTEICPECGQAEALRGVKRT